MNARDNILGRIRAALGRSRPLTDSEAAPLRAILRENRRGPLPTMNWEPVSRFRERCVSLSSTIEDIADVQQIPAAAKRYLASNRLPSACVCSPQFAGLDWAGVELAVEIRPATGQDAVGITGSYCAIAETGTLMLLSGPSNSMKNSLLPETHIAVVSASRILRCMEEGWDLLRKEHGPLPRQVAFVSGPSRTADIEMTLVIGIHGPYRVHVILVGA
jgi:L-lactate dehydrogenase complex protein LldG